MPIDEPPDLLYGLIVHELTHQFQFFDMIPSRVSQRSAAVGERGAPRSSSRGVWSPSI